MWNLIGHQRVLDGLDRALANGRLAQAYLLIGPEGVGKSTLALALAQAVNCQQPGPSPCGVCSQCRKIAAGNHPDVTVTVPEKGKRAVSVDQVRELQHGLSLGAYEGRCRVVILPDAGRLAQEASNALLKTLEEPAPDTLLVLTAGDEAAILPTIRSRCQTLSLQPVPTGLLTEALAAREGTDSEQARAAAAFARGRPGLALRALADPGLLEVEGERLTSLREAVRRDLAGRLALSGALAGGTANAALREALRALLETWLHWWRDALLAKTACDGPLVYPAEIDHYRAAADQLSLEELRAALAAVQDAQRQVEANANPRLVFDILLLRFPHLRLAETSLPVSS